MCLIFRLITASVDKTIKAWDTETGKMLVCIDFSLNVCSVTRGITLV